jgi:uncharacterized protein (TIGR01777 family)
MKIVMAGGTGFLGRHLAAALQADGHDLVVLSRRPGSAAPAGRVAVWTPDGSTGDWADQLDGAGAVVNLAGESIAGHRWSAAHKRRILDSRVLATRSLAAAIRRAPKPPATFVSASAVGYYGPLDDRIVEEDAPGGQDFMARVCARWEAEANAASPATRVVCLRTGLVLGRDGGALPPMLPPFWLGMGGPLGSGRQYWSWIHHRDWVNLVRFVLATPQIAGPLNATAPQPVTNRAFATALGRAMHRPALMPTPAFALRRILGEMADALVLTGQRVVPARARQFGFAFAYSAVQDALDALF